MKNACKRLFSLMLAVVLLVSVVPFQAGAESVYSVKIGAKYENGDVIYAREAVEIAGETTTVGNLLKHKVPAEAKETGLVSYWLKSADANELTDLNAEVKSGDEIVFVFKNPANCDEGEGDKTPVEKHYVTVGVKVDGEFTMEETKVEINGATATAADLLKYKAQNVSGNFVSYWTKSNGDSTDLDAVINEGDRIIFVFETEKEEVDPIKVVVKVKDSDNVVFQGLKVPANGEYALAKDLLTYAWNRDWDDVYSVDHAWSHKQQKNVGDEAKIYAGDTLYFMLNTKGTNNGGSGSNDGSTGNGKDKHDVYLNIYTWDGVKASSATLSMQKNIGGKDQLAWDGKLEWDELKQYVRKYYNAKDADGIDYDGMYIEKGSNIYNWLTDSNKHEKGIFDLDERRAENTVYVSVFISNAVKKSSGTADSSNPKTGDEIFMTVTVMAVSAIALAGAYVFNKKRMVK